MWAYFVLTVMGIRVASTFQIGASDNNFSTFNSSILETHKNKCHMPQPYSSYNIFIRLPLSMSQVFVISPWKPIHNLEEKFQNAIAFLDLTEIPEKYLSYKNSRSTEWPPRFPQYH
ncbi:hypothetical protein CEXT_320401 [Caerostris extrusa]|uniref:Uncharacterized protein n=1 Tax=Caerostris extrusa TaxID=172846 RepID=A0AAV4RDG2_CAEEX|nr:hypothetical protein CEXT_320401 [Caerostris extrusa]